MQAHSDTPLEIILHKQLALLQLHPDHPHLQDFQVEADFQAEAEAEEAEVAGNLNNIVDKIKLFSMSLFFVDK